MTFDDEDEFAEATTGDDYFRQAYKTAWAPSEELILNTGKEIFAEIKRIRAGGQAPNIFAAEPPLSWDLDTDNFPDEEAEPERAEPVEYGADREDLEDGFTDKRK